MRLKQIVRADISEQTGTVYVFCEETALTLFITDSTRKEQVIMAGYKLVVVSKFNGTDNEVVNGFHYRWQSGTPVNEPQALVDAWMADVSVGYYSLIHSTLTGVKMSVYDADTGLTLLESGANSGIPGGGGGEALPNIISAVVKWQTAYPGRSGKGRTFMPPAGEANSSGNIVQEPYRTFVRDVANSMILITDPATAAEFQLQVRSETLGISNDVVSASVRDQWGRQARRFS